MFRCRFKNMSGRGWASILIGLPKFSASTPDTRISRGSTIAQQGMTSNPLTEITVKIKNSSFFGREGEGEEEGCSMKLAPEEFDTKENSGILHFYSFLHVQ